MSIDFGDINLTLIYRSIFRSNNSDPISCTAYGMAYPLSVAWLAITKRQEPPEPSGDGNADSPTGIRANAHLF